METGGAGGGGGTDHSRRDALARGAGIVVGGSLLAALLGGCASGGTRTSGLPSPMWPGSSGIKAKPAPKPTPAPAPATGMSVISRAEWTRAEPNYRNMTRMQPIQRITLHHDGMSTFTSTNYDAARQRIESIRNAHASKPGWGDIGYHYVIDPAGRIWEARSMGWQGAHVKDQNPGNIGICLLGNYEQQSPSDTQLAAVEKYTAALMRKHNIAVRNVHTHKELAPTACPGRNLQPRLVAMRQGRGALAMA